MGAPGRVLLLFLDGVGVGEADPEVNPFARADLPCLHALLGGRLLVRKELGTGPQPGGAGAWVVAADARLGMDGLPQSGTGQTTLLTGVNAAARFGRHFGPWVPTGLRELLARENLLSRAGAAGRGVAFANAYPADFLARREGRRPAAPPLAALAAGALTRHAAELRAGRAVASSITNEAWRRHLDAGVPDVSAEEAGRALARVVGEAELTLFAHYDTDLVGHRGGMTEAVHALERVDGFVRGLLDHVSPDALVVLASDHGNVEDVTRGHTLNPIPVIARGPGAERVAAAVRSIADVAPVLLELLDVDRSDST